MRYPLNVLLTIVVFFSLSQLPIEAAAINAAGGDELVSRYVTIIDDRGTIVLQTGHEVHPGDEYISEDDILYEITSVEGTLARCRSLEKLSSRPPNTAIFVQAPPPEAARPIVAIYHSHTDESYIPNDGTPTERGNGSIMAVGDVFEKKLLELGYQVNHSKTLHDPHDANAYHRSRRTAMKLLQEQPAAIFDIHRDSAPLKVYSTTINGENVSKLLLVVGRQNQNKNTTLDFARNIKAAADAQYRGLIRGIFIAHGNYNQDLSPQALLIEAGTQYNNREAAERSISLFADIVPSILGSGNSHSSAAEANQAGTYTDKGGNNPNGTPASSPYTPIESAPSYDMAGILLTVAIGIIAFLFLSTGNWQEAKTKLKHFFKFEFVNFLGPYKRRKE
jgi:stage II sporulation protein P